MQEQKRHITIRDAVESDIKQCLQLDHSYETDYVWQVNLQNQGTLHTITLREDRLPRRMEVDPNPEENLFVHALDQEHCFLVAVNSDKNVLGYLVMLRNALKPVAELKAVTVDKPHRDRNIAPRLMTIAHKWASQRHIRQVLAETQTKNFPTISLYQQAGYTFCGFNDQYFTNRDIAVFFSLTVR